MQLFLSGWIILAIVLIGCNGSDEERGTDENEYGEYEIADSPVPDLRNASKLHVVQIIQMKFVPEVLNVNKGDTIMWINKDMVDHDITEQNSKSWTSSRVPGGASWKMAVTKSEAYYCSLHVVMTGKIIVGGDDIAMVALPEVTVCR